MAEFEFSSNSYLFTLITTRKQACIIQSYATKCLALLFCVQVQEPTMSDKSPSVSRRSLFAGAATVGAVAAATSVLPTVVKNCLPQRLPCPSLSVGAVTA
jgi:hypothetical protein